MTNKATQFKKGFDPRRPTAAGITEYRKTIRELMKDRAHQAIDYMFEVVNDKTAAKKLRLAAARDIADRYYGKAVDRVAVLTMDAEGAQDASTMTDNQLEQVINNLVNKKADNCIDVEYEETDQNKTK